MEASGQVHAPVALLPGKDPFTHITEDWVGQRTGLDAVAIKKNPCPCR